MKAKYITRLRARIAEKGYWAKREAIFAKRCDRWNNFERFECSSFFRGSECASRNTDYYNANAPRDKAKHAYYLRKCKENNEKLIEV